MAKTSKKPQPTTAAVALRSPYFDLAILLALMIPLALIRLRVADVPMGRDEGEYAYAGQQILKGIPPYSAVFNMKFPGTYYAYSVIMSIFGQTPWGIRAGLTVVNFITSLVFFGVAKRVVDRSTALLATVAFLVLSLDRWIQGTFAHATHFALLPALCGILLLWRAVEKQAAVLFVASGALLTMALLSKQQAMFFLPFGLWFAFWRLRRERRETVRALTWILAGAALAGTILLTVLAAYGVLQQFYFWTFKYALEYVSVVSLSDGWGALLDGIRQITRATLPLWMAGVVGLFLLFATKWPRDTRTFIVALGIASFLTVCPGLYFRTHYYILMLPALALCIAVGLTSVGRWVSRAVPLFKASQVAVVGLVLLTGLYINGEFNYLFMIDTPTLARQVYGANPFVEVPAIAHYIRDHSDAKDTLFILGSEPELYFLAQRRSSTGYIYMYPLMEPQAYASTMQDDVIAGVERDHPKFLVMVLVSSSWLSRPSSDQHILHWAERYTSNCYNQVGIADIYADKTVLLWDAQVTGYVPQSQYQILVFERGGAEPCAAG